jgi:hypothetical protein
MKIKVLVEFKANSIIEVEVPDGTPKNKVREEVTKSLQFNPLPEVVKNPTIEFLYATSATISKPGPKGEFSGEPIELDD